MGKINVHDDGCSVRNIYSEIKEYIDKNNARVWKVVKKSRWTRGYNCRRHSRTFGSWR